MNYECKTISLRQLVSSDSEILKPLCDNCATSDCSNPIQYGSVSIMGINEKHKVFMRSGDEPFFVILCKGFIDKKSFEE